MWCKGSHTNYINRDQNVIVDVCKVEHEITRGWKGDETKKSAKS